QNARAAVIQTHFQDFWRDESPGPHDQLGTAGPILLHVHGDQSFDHVALTLSDASHVGPGRTCRQAELGRVVNQVHDLGAPDLVLAGQAVDIRTGAADPFSLYDGRTPARGGQVPGKEL